MANFIESEEWDWKTDKKDEVWHGRNFQDPCGGLDPWPCAGFVIQGTLCGPNNALDPFRGLTVYQLQQNAVVLVRHVGEGYGGICAYWRL